MYKKTFILILMIGFILSCNNNDDDATNLEQAQICDSSNTTFNQLYNIQLNDPNIFDYVSMDGETHGYTFEVITDKRICGIGYRSQPTFEMFPYLIEIYDNTNNSIVYSDYHTFSSVATEHVSIGSILLTAGNSYTIKRVQNNSANDISILVGRLISTPNMEDMNFPLLLDNLIITESWFTRLIEGTIVSVGLPYIDLVFE